MKYFIFSFLFFGLYSCSSNNAAPNKTIEPKAAATKYTLATVEKGGVASTIKLPAQLAAFQEVSIFPKVNGYVKSVQVDIGSRVTKGTVLMVLEAPELVQAALQAREKYARTKADFAIDKERYQRLLEAAKTAGAISPLDLSSIKAKMEADSAVSNAEKANWQMQQTMLDYLKVVAPFAGVITERNVHPGALVSASVKDKPMLELKQIDHLRLQVDIPEALAGNLKNKDTVSFYVSALQGKKLTGNINRSSMNVNAQYRSERMEVDVPNKEGALAPGMFADMLLYSKGNVEALFVPKSAVVTSTERKYVLVMNGDKITKVDVSTGNQTANKIEVFGALKAGDQVIAVANDEIKETT
ncbi:efflux RND transporter periplasmic adaptor subunit [Ferruginibacter paludis]|uniref:efflux RND transporter periplasmic adaptor subunit n=1 Tax=Ferruginibacter paludis TaxID=1310417 RepID=UPI0025B579A1|nr:efflux RND transporter periplasmic adaptor subunit [Ferruginibacter paludis]MDN3654339.1 efflux RND transporter periplasmic adaptor subunit [Ferruginibacter paludis]